MTSTFNWDDISIDNANSDLFFAKRHIKHERVYYDLVSGSKPTSEFDNNKKLTKNKTQNKENVKAIASPDKTIKNNDVINNLSKMCNNQLKICGKTNSNCRQPTDTKNAETITAKNMAPPTSAPPSAYGYAEIYKKRKEIKAIEAGQKVVPPPAFKSKPLPTFYKSIKASTNAKPNRGTIPITPMVLKRSAQHKKAMQNKLLN